jgi:hypothetical protein
MSVPTRIDDELFRHAQAVSASQDRGAAQQINHWARLGAAVEATRVSHQELADVLAGRRSYDDVDDDYTQAAVRVAWEEDLEARREQLNLAEAFAAEGRRSWVVADDDGNPVEITAG